MPVRIQIACPTAAGPLGGNRVTATRWARILRALGHRVRITTGEETLPGGLLVALHAVRGAAAIRRSRATAPERPVILALTGTDLYRALPGSRTAQRSLELADRLVVLEPNARDRLPAAARRRTRVIHQSVTLRPRPRRRAAGPFRVCVVGHLRAVKDPFRAALAARGLPEASRIQVIHLGRAWSESFAERARAETRRNPRYRWMGPRARAATLRTLGGS